MSFPFLSFPHRDDAGGGAAVSLHPERQTINAAETPGQRGNHSQGPPLQGCGNHVSKVSRQWKAQLVNAEELAALKLETSSLLCVLRLPPLVLILIKVKCSFHCRATLKNSQQICLDPQAKWVKMIINRILHR